MGSWQVFSAVILRKFSEIAPRMDPIHSKVQAAFSAYEVAKSRLSNHEIELLQDAKLREEGDPTINIKETAQDRADRWISEKESFQFATYDDRLSYTQYLFVRQNFGSDPKTRWLVPQTLYDPQQDNDLLDTARRAIKERLGIESGFNIVSKVPSSVHSYKYPKKVADQVGHIGAKVFFLKAHVDRPGPEVKQALFNPSNSDLKWLTKNEAIAWSAEIPSDYLRSLCFGLLNENRVDTNRVLARVANYTELIQGRLRVASSQ